MPLQQKKVVLTIPAEFAYLSLLGPAISIVVQQIAKRLDEATCDSVIGDLTLATHEVCANIIDHAYEGESDASISITIGKDGSDGIEVSLADNGRSYDPHILDWPPPHAWRITKGIHGSIFTLVCVPVPDIDQDRGRGIFLMGQLVNCVEYRPMEGRNVWRLLKKV